MKLFLPIALLCLLAVVSCKKVDQQSKEKSHTWSQKKSHNVKKYSEEKFHHHDKHQKIHPHKYPDKHEQHPIDGKQHKGHHGFDEVPKHEAELQKDIKATKKEIEDRLAKEEQDLHLQDLTHPSDPANMGHKNLKSPHGYQSGHSKTNHQFSHSEGQKVHKAQDEKLQHHKAQDEKLQHHKAQDEKLQHHKGQDEKLQHHKGQDEKLKHHKGQDEKLKHHKGQDEKLFVFPESKEPESKQSHPVLEDSFEAVGEEVVHEQPEHSHSKKKDSSKNKKSHKKAYEKVKEKTKKKEYEKTKSKDDKKDKKQQYKGKKDKQ